MTTVIAKHANNALEGVVHTNAKNAKYAKTTNVLHQYVKMTMNAMKDACVMLITFAVMLNACMTFTAENAETVLVTNALLTTANAENVNTARQMDMCAWLNLVEEMQDYAHLDASAQTDCARFLTRHQDQKGART